MLTVGSLCTGYGGLDLAVAAVFGQTRLSWVSDIEKGPRALLEHRHPGVPNLGDITTVNWSMAEPVDVLTAGYPCQPFSQAGRRKGTKDERHIWPHISEAIGVLGPRRVVLENVAGHLSLGGPAVVGELADLGYRVRWVALRAADVGACHGRRRLFILADANCDVRGRGSQGLPATQDRQRGRGDGDGSADGRRAVVADSDGQRCEGAEPEPCRDDRRGGGLVADAHRIGCKGVGWLQPCVGPRCDPDRLRTFGKYAAAVHRHEHAFGRVAPAPSDAKRRLSPKFVEWMMMLPEGHVTDVPGLSRTAQLRLLGNGVVPPQAEYALRLLEAA